MSEEIGPHRSPLATLRALTDEKLNVSVFLSAFGLAMREVWTEKGSRVTNAEDPDTSLQACRSENRWMRKERG